MAIGVLAAVFVLLFAGPVDAQAQLLAEGSGPEQIPHLCGSESLGAAVSAASTATVAQQQWRTVPAVIWADGLDSFNVEVKTNRPVRRVTLRWGASARLTHRPEDPTPYGARIDLLDDGLGVDAVAGDLVATAGPFAWRTDPRWPRSPIVAPASPIVGLYSSPGRPDAGPPGIDAEWLGEVEIEELDGTVNDMLIPPAVGLIRSDVEPAQTLMLGPDVQVSQHVVNLRTERPVTQHAVRQQSDFGLRASFRKVYQVVPDQVHFWTVFSNYHVEYGAQTSAVNFISGVHHGVKTDFSGVGLWFRDFSTDYGSRGVLRGVNILDSFRRGILSMNDAHEFSHQWAAFLDYSLGLGRGDGAHWIGSLVSTASTLGGYQWSPNPDGTFTIDCTQGQRTAFQLPPIERYLAGLAYAHELPAFYRTTHEWLAEDFLACFQQDIPFQIEADEVDLLVTVEDIQSIHGRRVPQPHDALRQFVVAYMVESVGRFLTPAEMTFYEILAAARTAPVPPDQPDPRQSAKNWVSMERFVGDGASVRGALVTCGDGTLQFEERCDDGNNHPGDGCSPDCRVEPSPDPDFDGVDSPVDNCPQWPNSSQADHDGNGIGTACECGDLSRDGDIDEDDSLLLRAWLAGVVEDVRRDLCSLWGDEACDLTDWVVLQREIQGASPGARQVCGAALGTW